LFRLFAPDVSFVAASGFGVLGTLGSLRGTVGFFAAKDVSLFSEGRPLGLLGGSLVVPDGSCGFGSPTNGAGAAVNGSWD